MRALGIAVAVALTISTGGVAVAADDGLPSRQDVRQAEVAVQAKAQDVESVRAQLVLANQRLQSSAIAAAQAAEAANGARYAAQEARTRPTRRSVARSSPPTTSRVSRRCTAPRWSPRTRWPPG